jgi:alkanesulfonate monooxygenase SsuD/methylene tetrahydromethanopterin reductase-like flavin-dependent oxidoreductase (luciferase family)
MQVGSGFIFGSLEEGVSDREFIDEEMRLAVLSEELGFDFIGIPEHHFEDYSMAVNPLQLLTWVGGRTSRIGLMTAVVVLPWHDPLRVVEEAINLDNLTGGRLMLGVGRGLARKEYDGFRVDREEARERFDEAAELVKRSVETGIIEGSGKFYKQPRAEIRPRPFKSFNDRFYSVANSPGSAELAGRIGARLVMFVASHLSEFMGHVDLYRETYQDTFGKTPPPILLSDSTFCTRDPELTVTAREVWYRKYYKSVVDHYEFDTTDFTQVKGYEAHARRGGEGVDRWDFPETQVWGTPEQIIERYKERVEILGDVDAKFVLRFGGMPGNVAEASMRLFAAEVMPELRKLGARASGRSEAVAGAGEIGSR